jgi:hypothetical protein
VRCLEIELGGVKKERDRTESLHQWTSRGLKADRLIPVPGKAEICVHTRQRIAAACDTYQFMVVVAFPRGAALFGSMA